MSEMGMEDAGREMDGSVVPMDLKPDNILLDGPHGPKNWDFDLWTFFGQNQIRINTQNIVGTL
jgi:hypothetical protein